MDDATSLEIAIGAARNAGGVAMSRIGDPGYVTWKGNRDVVSESILRVQEVIVTALSREPPHDAMLLEERPSGDRLEVEAERRCIVDPSCGSLNFANGLPSRRRPLAP